MKLADRICVVTGGARGIGEAIASRFAANGATVAILDSDGAAAAATAARQGATGYQCDVSSRASVEARGGGGDRRARARGRARQQRGDRSGRPIGDFLGRGLG